MGAGARPLTLKLAPKAKGLGVAEGEGGEAFGGDRFSAADGSREREAGEVALRGAGEMAVPDIGEGVIEADALKAVIEANRPAMLAGKGGEGLLGEVLEVGYGVGHWDDAL